MTNRTNELFAGSNFKTKLQFGIRQGLKKGWAGLIWILKIILPISFATTLLVHFGIIYKLDFILTPVMTWLRLPASAALVLVVGVFTGIYGTVAALSVMPFSVEHMTLIAVFTLISHNLIQESMVQGQSGINPVFAAIFRLFMSLMVTFACGRIMGVTAETALAPAAGNFAGQAEPFIMMLQVWGLETFWLVIKIFWIIMIIMVFLELGKVFNVISFVTRITAPGLAVLGLSRSTGMLWLTAVVFGLAYGSAVIVEETRTNEYEKDELTRLHLSIGINHSIIEDPALFLPLGLPVFWLWIPRIIAAMMAVWLHWGLSSARRVYAKRAGHKKLCDH
ncbi:MAG: iron transporter [Pseudomonadota bacterium]